MADADRLARRRSMTGRPIRLRSGTHEFDVVDRGDGKAAVGDAWFHVFEAGPARWRVGGPSSQTLVHAAWDGTVCWVHADGRVWRLERVERTGTSTGTAADDQALAAPMPASVRAIHAAPGQPVTRGDVLIVLEAMKMELPIRAPRDGVVSAVRCSVGELVQPGARLVELA